MFEGCAECTRLWREYSTAAARHLGVEVELRRATLANHANWVAELVSKSEAAADAHKNAREAIRQHESMVHE